MKRAAMPEGYLKYRPSPLLKYELIFEYATPYSYITQ